MADSKMLSTQDMTVVNFLDQVNGKLLVVYILNARDIATMQGQHFEQDKFYNLQCLLLQKFTHTL